MKRLFLFALMLFILSLLTAPVFAQTDRASKNIQLANGKDMAFRELNLSEDQQAAIKRIKANYLNKIVHLRTELAAKQVEFKSLIGDPTAVEEAIRTRGREIEAINGQIMREMISFELEVRRILTPEQLRTWCRNMDSTDQKKWGKYP
jgi:Spy/CpxP family protein refolding chaperone